MVVAGADGADADGGRSSPLVARPGRSGTGRAGAPHRRLTEKTEAHAEDVVAPVDEVVAQAG